MKQLSVNVHGIEAIIETDINSYYQFVENNYLIFKKDVVHSKARVFSVFSIDAGNFAKEQKNSLNRISEGFYMGTNSIYWENEFGFSIFLDFSTKDSWKVYSFHFDLLKKLNAEDEYKNYMRSMRWAVHFPIFTLLDYLKGIKLIHASAVSKNNNSILFCGLNKVGKSGLGLYFFKNLNYKIVSDNFLLIGKEGIYAFPEMARVSPEGSKNLKLKIKNKQLIYGKYHLPIASKDIALKSSPMMVYIVTNSDQEYTEEIPRDKAILLLDSIHNYLQEFPRYTFYGILDYFEFNSNNSTGINIFPKNTRFFILSHKMNWDYKSISERVIRDEV